MPLVVAPDSFAAASRVLGDGGWSLWNAVTARTDHPGMAGDDPTGRSWGASFDAAAREAVAAAESVLNGLFRLAGLLEQSGFNYSVAESASSGSPVEVDRTAWDSVVCRLPEPPASAGAGAGLPVGWSVVEDLVKFVWPNGHQDRLWAASLSWSQTAAKIMDVRRSLAAAQASLLDSVSPEADAAAVACAAMRGHVQDLASAYASLGCACADYARALDEAHAEVIDALEDLALESAVISAAGLVLGLITRGATALPAEGVEAWRLAAAAVRITTAIERLTGLVSTIVSTRIVAAGDRIAGTVAALRPLLLAEPAAATGVLMVRGGEVARAVRAARMEARAERRMSKAARARAAAAEKRADEIKDLGAKGTNVTSQPVAPRRCPWRMDVENPGGRGGQLHIHVDGQKYLYDFDAERFMGMSKSLSKRIMGNPYVQAGIKKSEQVLGLK